MTADPPTSAMSPPPLSKAHLWGRAFVVVPLAIFGIIKGCNLLRDVDHSRAVAEMFGGAEIVKTIQEPDRVTVQRRRLLPSHKQTDAEGGFARANYEPLTDPISVSDSTARELASVLTAGSSYEWDDRISKPCIPSYWVKLVFHRGDRHVEVWLCFECKVFVVFEPIEYATSQDASGYGNFDLFHDELADIMQRLFPGDEAIQAL